MQSRWPLSLTRRQFAFSAAAPVLVSRLAGAANMPWEEPALVAKAYVGVANPSWPRPSIDVNQDRAEVEARLADLERRHPGAIHFTGGAVLGSSEQVQAYLASLGDVDGMLVVPLTSRTDALAYQLGDSGIPTLLFLRPYYGFQYGQFSELVQSGRKADILPTSDYGDLDIYARVFQTIRHLRKSRVLQVDPGTYYAGFASEFTRQFGTEIKPAPFTAIEEAARSVDERQAGQATERYLRGALRVVEPARQEVYDSIRLYLGIRELLKREKANAITVDCLGGFQRGDLKAYPCVAWSRLNDEGLYGVCQGDLQCTFTQIMLTAFSGKPGYVFNPVFDTSRNEVICAHCVAPTSPLGIGGPSLPYILRSHMEDNKGVAVQVLMPVGGAVTMGKFLDAKTFRMATGEALGNVDSPSGCRTQVRARVADARKMALGFTDRGIHRVLYYGDYSVPLERMSRLMGFRLAREC